MSKFTPLIPTEILLRELHSLSGSIRIIPDQVTAIIGLSRSQLLNNRTRKQGAMPFVREGGKILYRIEDVRNYVKAQLSDG
jgi:hypothetical protein